MFRCVEFLLYTFKSFRVLAFLFMNKLVRCMLLKNSQFAGLNFFSLVGYTWRNNF